MTGKTRIVSWNIRAGGGRRVEGIARQVLQWEPDVVALCEYRATRPSAWLGGALAQSGLRHQRRSEGVSPSANGLLLASRWPLREARLAQAPPEPGRWLLARVLAPCSFMVGVMHAPNRVTGRKYPFLNGVLALARAWHDGPALFVGDTNSGLIGLDEEHPTFSAYEDGWVRAMEDCDWRDAFRYRRGDARASTWYSPNAGNGFRLDQAFVNAGLLPRLLAAKYQWARVSGRRDALSDHAALIIDLEPQAYTSDLQARS